jgi:electron transfer flavoprotein alpha subunit
MSVLCLIEQDSGEIAPASLRALAVARALAAASGDQVTAVVFPGAAAAEAGGAAAVASAVSRAGLAPAAIAELGRRGVARIRVISVAGLDGYAPAAWARGLQQLAAADPEQAVAVVAAATDRGSEVLAHLGAMTGLPVAANCLSAVPGAEPGSWQLVRQRWAGSVLEEAELAAPWALLTVAADAEGSETGAADETPAGPEAPAGETAAGEAPGGFIGVRAFQAQPEPADLLVRATESAAAAGGLSLATARVVVGGGRGVGGPEGFAALEELAGLLGGVVGVSRVVTSQGWRPHRQQVGQTGTKISPELYLACGISGAIQHMAGCQGARHLVVINTDPDAPIVGRAEYAVIGDLHEVIPALVAAIRGG